MKPHEVIVVSDDGMGGGILEGNVSDNGGNGRNGEVGGDAVCQPKDVLGT